MVNINIIGPAPTQTHKRDTGHDVAAVSRKVRWPFYVVYDTGLSVEPIDPSFAIQDRARSSIYERGLILSNSVGTIDNPYRGPIKFIFYTSWWTWLPWFEKSKDGKRKFRWNRLYRVGDRIGQLVVERVPRVSWNDTTVLSETTRGTDGYGSTGQN